EFARAIHFLFAEEGASDLQDQIDVVIVSQGEDGAEGLERLLALSELEQRLTQPGERVFMLGVEYERPLERAACPGILLTRQPRVARADVQLHGVGIEREPLPQHVQGL